MEPVASAARAFEFADAWELTIEAARYKLEELKRTSIERALVRAVVTQSDEISVQALYRILTARQRLTVVLPPGAQFDAQSLRIDGRPASLETGKENEYFIPLANANADKPFVVELRYTLKGDGRRIDPPVFSEESAVVKEFLCVYLPETRKLLFARGPWTNDIDWHPDRWLRWRPRSSANSLVNWVQGDLTPGNPAGDFAADGEPYLFSTQRPAPPPEGSLRLKTISSRWLDGLVFIVTVLLGVLLLPARLPAKWLVVGAAVIAVVLSGVFLPIFSRQVLNGVLLAAVFVVAIMWSIAAIAHCSCRKPCQPQPAGREHGVDLSKYRPEPPVVEPAPPAPKSRPRSRQRNRPSRTRRKEGRTMRKVLNDCKLQIDDCKLQIEREIVRFRKPAVVGTKVFCNLQFTICNLQFFLVVLAIGVPLLFSAIARAAEKSNPAEDARPAREIYVPFSDLHVLLQDQPRRVLIGRKEYDALLKKAKRMPKANAPLPAVITAADYSIKTDRRRAEIVGDLTVDVLQDGLHALPLDLGGVGLRTARLDDHAAAIGRDRDGRLMLFVEGVGQHRLKLEMTAPLETTAARQVLNYRLPRPPAATLRLEVPGDVEIKGGAAVVSRVVDSAAKVTRFELLPQPGDTSLLMTLNSHLRRQERAVVARTVVFDEVADAYEKLRASVTLSILHRAVDRFRFVVPEGFEITEVSSPLLARWEVVSDSGRRVLDARLREETTETVTLDITAIRAPAKLDGWHAPRLVPLDVIGSVTVLGLLVDDRLKAESLAAEGLIPIDTSVLGAVALPLRAVAAWYAPQGAYALTAAFVRPKAEMDAGTGLLLVASDKGLDVHGYVLLMPRVDKRFSFDVSVPAGWQVTAVKTAGGMSLPFEFYPAADSPHPNPLPKGEGTGIKNPLPEGEGIEHISPLPLGEGQGVRAEDGGRQSKSPESAKPASPKPRIPVSPNPAADSPHPNPLPKGEGTGSAGRVRVTIADGIEVGKVFQANFRAVCTPSDWLSEWRRTTVEFPRFAVLGATGSEGAIAVETRDDLTVRPAKIARLVPLGAEERPGFGLAGIPAELAYRCEGADFTATLAIERTEPRLTARTFSFFRVDRDALFCHYEIQYTIEQSRTGRLAFSLPKDTPEAIAIVGLDGVQVKDPSDKPSAGRRQWTVSLAEPRRGRVRLAVDFSQRLPTAEPKSISQNVAQPPPAVQNSSRQPPPAVQNSSRQPSPAVQNSSRQPGAAVPQAGIILPIVEAEGVAYQSGLVSIEGCAELEVKVDAGNKETALRPVDVGELAAADYQPGRRLLGAYEFVGNPPPVKIDVVRQPGYDIPPAIVQQCELDTFLAPDGRSRTQAVFLLRSKSLYLQIALPDDSKLWAAELDGVPLKPQRDRGGVLVDLSAGKGDALKTLKIIYADNQPQPVALRGRVRVSAPKLSLHERGTAAPGRESDQQSAQPGAAVLQTPLPLVDFVWRLHLPSGYEVVKAGGTLSTDQVERPRPAAFQLARDLYGWCGGVRGPGWMPLPTGGCSCSKGPARVAAPAYDREITKSVVSMERPEMVFVGRITGMKNCRWSDPQTQSYMGSSVPLGRKYSLSSGLMEITFNNGAKVILEGPATYEVESNSGGYLALGKLTARTEARGKPYTLRTPTAVVTVAPGTEISQDVSEDGGTLARVYGGAARMQSVASGKARELTPGHFLTVDSGDDTSGPSEVAFNIAPRFYPAAGGIAQGARSSGHRRRRQWNGRPERRYAAMDLAKKSAGRKENRGCPERSDTTRNSSKRPCRTLSTTSRTSTKLKFSSTRRPSATWGSARTLR